MKGYQPYSTFVEEDVLPQNSFMFSNVIFVTLWHSSKAAYSVCHDKVLDILITRKTHLKYTTKQQRTNKKIKVEWVGQQNFLRTPCYPIRSRNAEGR